MRAVLQRVSSASVQIDGKTVGAINRGILLLLAAGDGDTDADADWMVNKIAALRFFSDEAGRMNLSVEDVGGGVLLVSQFTLYGDCRKGRRPSFVHSMEPVEASRLVDRVRDGLLERGLPVETGEFGAMMQVALVNDGPVTLIVDSPAKG